MYFLLFTLYLESNKPLFENRYKKVLLNIPVKHLPFIMVASRMRCITQSGMFPQSGLYFYLHYSLFLDFRKYAKVITKSGGEGVMFRKPDSTYENGRSSSVLKYKVFTKTLTLFPTEIIFSIQSFRLFLVPVLFAFSRRLEKMKQL